MTAAGALLRAVALCAGLAAAAAGAVAPAAEGEPRPNAVTPDGGRYFGPLKDGKLHGRGRVQWPNGAVYEGELADGVFHGKGRFRDARGEIYEGDFVNGRRQGFGSYLDAQGNRYEGAFTDGELSGFGKLTGKEGGTYEGDFRQWRFHGQGVLRHPNGDEYRGRFANGAYDGEGTLRYARPRPDGRTEDKGLWRAGKLDAEAEREQTMRNVEAALHLQRPLLEAALASLAPRAAGRINLYLLAVAGDGTEEVFRREAEAVREQFDRNFGTRGRSLALVNSRNTVASAPMATLTSLREALRAIAARMDREQDILFLFLTSHGTSGHELLLDQSGMPLRDLRPADLAGLLRETGIRWKVVVVSSCYSGGFLEPLKSDQTLVITAARHDRQSFGCADDNDFTYFGRAFFKEALPGARSFQDAFAKAEALVRTWELREKHEHSLPQLHDAAPINGQLARWWSQRR